MVLILIAIWVAMYSIQRRSINGSNGSGSEAIVIEIAIERRGVYEYSLSCFGMRYNPNEIAIKLMGCTM